MKKTSCLLALWVLVGPTLYAQEGSVVALGGRLAQRASARVLYMNQATNSFVGQLVINGVFWTPMCL